MRALGGAITSSCSNDSESRRHRIRSLDRPNLLFQLMASVSNGHNVGTLWETAGKFGFHYCILSTCTVATNAEFFASRVV